MLEVVSFFMNYSMMEQKCKFMKDILHIVPFLEISLKTLRVKLSLTREPA